MDTYSVLAFLSVVFTAVTLVVVLVYFIRRPSDVATVIPPIQSLTQEMGRLQADLRGLHERIAARQHLDQQNADAIRRLEAIIAGTHTKGLAGENLIDLVFSQLPAEWQVRNFHVGNKVVEFGLRLPNKLILPIDSKWPATHLIEQFVACTDPTEQLALKAEIERVVTGKVREVRKYILPDLTADFAIAAVPDAAFELCAASQVQALRMNVVLLAYSMIVPYLLLTFQTVLRTYRDVDVQRIASYLATAAQSLDALRDELEGRFSRSLTMLSNSRDDMRMHLATISTGLASVEALTPAERASERLAPGVSSETSTAAPL